MARAERFEDLVAWQKARALAKAVYGLTALGPISRDFGLIGQMQRAAVSVMSNIAEGMERTGKAEFRHFLTIAKASCAELRSQLYVAVDVGYITEAQFQQMMAQAEETGRVIGGLRASLNRSRLEP
jgi:four helix bundle protein